MKICISIFMLISIFGCVSPKTPEFTNIIVLLADDLGYADLRSYGGVAHTPNLDCLAMGGIRFTNFYAAAPNCSPSRAGYLTGKSPSIVGMYSYRPSQHPMHLQSSEVTIAERLKEANYQTAYIGKWHMGALVNDTIFKHPQPTDQGFDYFFGTESNAQPSHLNPSNFVRNDQFVGQVEGYSCDILVSDAVSWINNRNASQPFFLTIAFHEPHKRVASPPHLIERYTGWSRNDAEYLANVENLDQAIGRLINFLDRSGLKDNTMIVFTSDNGSYRETSNGDLRGKKGMVYEGGIRVPGLIHWSGLKRDAGVVKDAVGLVDLLPTFLEMNQLNRSDDLAGTSLLGLLRGDTLERQKPLSWFFYRSSPEMMMRIGEYAILGKSLDIIPRTHGFTSQDMDFIDSLKFDQYELYDLNTDLKESNNIIEDHPMAEEYISLLQEQLTEIQTQGYQWAKLPEPTKEKRLKTKWLEE